MKDNSSQYCIIISNKLQIFKGETQLDMKMESPYCDLILYNIS